MKDEDVQIERCSDPLDMASRHEEAFTALALKAAAKNLERETHPDFDGQHCMECGNEIEDGRLKLHKIRCIECQRAIEQLNKLRSV